MIVTDSMELGSFDAKSIFEKIGIKAETVDQVLTAFKDVKGVLKSAKEPKPAPVVTAPPTPYLAPVSAAGMDPVLMYSLIAGGVLVVGVVLYLLLKK